jgi:hypothetical protein
LVEVVLYVAGERIKMYIRYGILTQKLAMDKLHSSLGRTQRLKVRVLSSRQMAM